MNYRRYTYRNGEPARPARVVGFLVTTLKTDEEYHFHMLQNLRAELKAIRQFQPSPEMRTQTERDAVLIRKIRIAELVTKIREIASMN